MSATVRTTPDDARHCMPVAQVAQSARGVLGTRVRMQASDEALMERIARGDHDAFGELVDRHMRRVVSLAQNVLGIAADADEVAQETFTRLWTQPGAYDPARARFTTWLHRVVVNQCIDRRRANRFEPLDETFDRASDEPPVAEFVYEEQRQAAVHAALARLPVRQRTALALFYMQDLSQREAASAMELSDSAFESLLHRARRALMLVLDSDDEGGSQ
jgi:RNA polymerase sigma-70 factor (ECF subfamily)